MKAAFRNEKKSNNADHNGDNEKQEDTVTGVHINCKQSQCTWCVKDFAKITLCRSLEMSDLFLRRAPKIKTSVRNNVSLCPKTPLGYGNTGNVELVRNLMAHAQKPVFVFRLNGRVQLNRRGSQFSRLLAAEVCASALVMPDTLRPEVV